MVYGHAAPSVYVLVERDGANVGDVLQLRVLLLVLRYDVVVHEVVVLAVLVERAERLQVDLAVVVAAGRMHRACEYLQRNRRRVPRRMLRDAPFLAVPSPRGRSRDDVYLRELLLVAVGGLKPQARHARVAALALLDVEAGDEARRSAVVQDAGRRARFQRVVYLRLVVVAVGVVLHLAVLGSVASHADQDAALLVLLQLLVVGERERLFGHEAQLLCGVAREFVA